LNEGPDLAESSAAAKASAKKVGAWLAALPEKPSQQSRTIQLMYAVKTARSAAVIAGLRDTLLALQNADGSWSQTPQMAGDAYATGQALYALGLAGRKTTDPAVARAVSFLTKAQLPEGNWPMTSRPMPPDRPGAGSTAKNLEPIATIGTGWALLGLLAVS
jgi:squalene-hopene/tetraprenyl-beta-curcumene cyclase